MGVSEEWLEPNIPGVFFICDREIPAEKRVPNKKDTPDTPTQAAWATYDLATWAPSGKQHTTSVFFPAQDTTHYYKYIKKKCQNPYAIMIILTKAGWWFRSGRAH